MAHPKVDVEPGQVLRVAHVCRVVAALTRLLRKNKVRQPQQRGNERAHRISRERHCPHSALPEDTAANDLAHMIRVPPRVRKSFPKTEGVFRVCVCVSTHIFDRRVSFRVRNACRGLEFDVVEHGSIYGGRTKHVAASISSKGSVEVGDAVV